MTKNMINLTWELNFLTLQTKVFNFYPLGYLALEFAFIFAFSLAFVFFVLRAAPRGIGGRLIKLFLYSVETLWYRVIYKFKKWADIVYAILLFTLLIFGTTDLVNNLAFFELEFNSSELFTLSLYPVVSSNKGVVSSIKYLTVPNLNRDFLEWFRGFTDAEGSFYIVRSSGSSFKFRFKILLHIDDKEVLYYIKNTLNIGKVSTLKSTAVFTVTAQKELSLILYIFTSICTLNTTKHLNLLAFKKAFELYWNISPQGQTQIFNRQELVKDIDAIKNSMNYKRSNYEMPQEHEIQITPYWLLGFVEGDGSFFVSNTFALGFSIKQKGNLVLVKAIQNFFNKLLTLSPSILSNIAKWKGSLLSDPDCSNSTALKFNEFEAINSLSIASISITKTTSREDVVHSITISREGYIKKVLIPFFDSMIWHTKKEMDYKDWKTILNIKSSGLYFTDKGKELIKSIASQMNNNRLSTSGLVTQDRTLQSEIEKLISTQDMKTPVSGDLFREGSGNYEKVPSNRRLWSNKAVIVHLVEVVEGQAERNILNSFNSLANCAKHLGISSSTLQYRIRRGKPFLFKDKLVNIAKM